MESQRSAGRWELGDAPSHVAPAVKEILEALDDVKDPEIPVVSVVELGIVQSIALEAGTARIAITPTFLGCPALEVMREEIAARVRDLGHGDVKVDVVVEPAWTSDRIAPAARQRMRSIGLAPPPMLVVPGRFQADLELGIVGQSGAVGGNVDEVSAPTAVECPFCGSTDTTVENAFGPTICRTLLYCRGCQQPFEQFKALG